MEIFGQIVTLYAALRKLGVSQSDAEKYLEEHSAKICLPDTIRYTIKGDDITGNSGYYSHYKYGFSMLMPFGEELKTFTNIHQTEFQNGDTLNSIDSMYIDRYPDITKLVNNNIEMFQSGDGYSKDNPIWGLSILTHWQHDEIWYHFWKNICNLTNTGGIVYSNTQKIVYQSQFQNDISLLKTYLYKIFVETIGIRFGDNMTIASLDYIRNSFKKWYSPEMAADACNHLDIEIKVFTLAPLEKIELEEKICDTRMFANKKQLYMMAIALFEKLVSDKIALASRIVAN